MKILNKTKQVELSRWLKQHSISAKYWLKLSMLLGSISGLLIIAQAYYLAIILQSLIMENTPREQLTTHFIFLLIIFSMRAILILTREYVGFRCGQVVRKELRAAIFEKIQNLGPIWSKGKPTGNWVAIVVEQIEDMQDYYSRYLPQIYLAIIIPAMILIAIFPFNWAAGLILFITSPLIPLFMALVGLGAADANRENFSVLERLSGSFLDRLRGLDTLRLFFRGKAEVQQISKSTENFRKRTMAVLRMAFLSSAVLEFFASISIAIVAVYFGFSFLGKLNFGSYGFPITLLAGFIALILSPEFFQPLRDLGTYYHAKAKAIGAADSLNAILNSKNEQKIITGNNIPQGEPIRIIAADLEILSHDGKCLVGPIDFEIEALQRIAIVGQSGAGKSSLLNLLLDFLPYRGSVKINGQELNTLCSEEWHSLISWVGENPHLPEQTLIDNIRLGNPDASIGEIQKAIEDAYISEFLPLLPEGLNTQLGDYSSRLSIGQAQRIAVARTLLKPSWLLLLDEPVASLDAHSELRVMSTLDRLSQQKTTLIVTHILKETINYDQIWVMSNGKIIQRGNYTQLSQIDGPFSRLLAYGNEEF